MALLGVLGVVTRLRKKYKIRDLGLWLLKTLLSFLNS
jgi:hypothetical protein